MNARKKLRLQTTDWLNVKEPLDEAQLRGKVVVLEAFQMLCPGCVAHGLPLAEKVHQAFSGDDLVVVGLHAVFEHHAAQGTREALAAFLHEYRFSFPIAIDEPSDKEPIPRTMAAFEMRGTPSLLLFDREGWLRQHYFGAVSELALGVQLAALLGESRQRFATDATDEVAEDGCTAAGCAAPEAPIDRRPT